MDAQTVLSKYRYEQSTGTFQHLLHASGRGVIKTPKGYVRVLINGKYFMAHHLVWLLHTGGLPAKQIDHVNGLRDDNRFENLREVSPVENSQNQRCAHKTSSTGLLGATPYRDPRLKTPRWRAQIRINGKSTHIGLFASAEEAHEAYLAAKRIHHPGCTI